MNSLLSNPLKSIIFVFHWQLRMKTKEEIFIEQINLKRREAYHELFRRFYRSLVIFALKYIDEQGEAEDIVQELFVSVWEKEEKFMSYASFRVFLYNAVRNTCLNRIKHKKVEKNMPLTDSCILRIRNWTIMISWKKRSIDGFSRR